MIVSAGVLATAILAVLAQADGSGVPAAPQGAGASPAPEHTAADALTASASGAGAAVDARAALGTRQDAGRAAPGAGAPTRFGRVDLRASGFDDDVPLSGFSWMVDGDAPGMAATGRTAGPLASLRVPLDLPISVRVAADAHVRSLPVDVSLRGGLQYRAVDVRLVPQVAGPSIALTVRTRQGRPVRWLRVTAAVHGQAADGGANSYRELWTRRSAAGDGVHALTGLAAGRYRIRLVALQEDGRPAMLLPVERLVRFDGAQCAEAEFVMEPAGSLVVVAEALAGDKQGLVPVLIEDAQGRARPRQWVAIGSADPRRDRVSTAAPCELFEPIPAGEYTLCVAGEPELRRPVTVFPGRLTTVVFP